MRSPTRLNPLTSAERIWYREAIAAGTDLFSEPTFHPDRYQFSQGKAIFPGVDEALTHNAVQLIKKNHAVHPSVWVRRLDLFLLTTENPDRIFSINLAAVPRGVFLEAQKVVDLPEGATLIAQTYWELCREIVTDTLYQFRCDQVFVSQFLQHLNTGELTVCNPIEGTTDTFTKENLASADYKPLTPEQRRFLRTYSLFQEHEAITDLSLDHRGFIVIR
jgi:hypothetical protein